MTPRAATITIAAGTAGEAVGVGEEVGVGATVAVGDGVLATGAAGAAHPATMATRTVEKVPQRAVRAAVLMVMASR
jgi:hypothetical protein